MGVQGLWQLLHPAGKPVSPTSLEGKVLAVDVSIWLHQTMKGMRDKDGNPLPNAHLQGLFSRVCKLLFYRICPVFVFDGGVPALKKQTLAVRREQKENIDKEKGRSTQKILENLLQSHAVRGLTGDVSQSITVPAKPGGQQDMFELPPLPEVDRGSGDPVDSVARLESEEDEFEDHRNLVQYYQEEFQDLEEIDCESEEFQSLPPEIRHEILTEMKEQRRENALARIAIMPEESKDFSDYQLKKLLKHSKLSSRIESVRKEMNNRVSGDITYALGDDYYGEVVEAQRVVSEDAAHYVLIKGLTHKQQVAEAERCKARRLVKEKRELNQNSDNKTMQSDAGASLDTVKEEPMENVDTNEMEAECAEQILPESNDEMCDDYEEKGKLLQREKRGKSLVTRNGLRSVAKKGLGKNRPARQLMTSENVEDDVVVTAVQTSIGSVSDIKMHRKLSSEQGVSEFVLKDDVGNIKDESIQDSSDLKLVSIKTEVTTPAITTNDIEENDDTITTNQCLKKTAKLTEDSNDHASDFVSNKTTHAEGKSKYEEDGGKSPQDESNFAETRNRLLTEEEDLLKAKEAKMAALMKSLEKRTQIIQSPQAQRKSSTDSMREKLIQQEEDIMKEKEAKMAALLQSVEKRSQLRSGQKPVNTQEKTDPDLQSQLTENFTEELDLEGKKTDSKIKCSENRETLQGFLEDVVEKEQCAISKKTKAKLSDSVASSVQQAASLSSSSSSAFPTLTADYLENIEGFEKPASTQPPPALIPEHQENAAGVNNYSGKTTKQAKTDISQKRSKRVSSEKLQGKPTDKKAKLVPASSSRTNEDEEKDSEDEGFIEITIDPSKLTEDDDLFPSSIFTTVPEDDTDTALHHTDKDKNTKKAQVSTTDYNAREDDADVEEVKKDDADKKHKDDSNYEEECKEDQLSEDKLCSKVEDKLKKSQIVCSVNLGRQESSERGSEVSVNEEVETEDGRAEADLSVLSSKSRKEENFTKGVDSLVDLFDLQRGLAAERRTLTLERGKQARLGKTVTEQINLEAQELLQLFGVPYVVSPMEAEAQCAHLELLGLTEGTITDDSDSWLFGASNVYKNFFNQSKYVEFYSANSVFQRFGMDREKLINIALLCGSDYTPGIPGVGPVRAIEILAEFPGEGLQGLRDFRDWWEEAKKGIIARNQGKVRNKLRTLQLHEGFPSRRVVDAYLKPAVDESEETFTWGLPDVELLRQFAKQKFGWGKQKADEILEPMMKELTKKTVQGRIHTYFQPENFVRPKTVQSKRLQAALDKFQAREEESGSSSAQSEFESDSESDSASQSQSESGDSDGGAEESKIQKSKLTPPTSAGRGRGSAGRGGIRGGKSKGLEAGGKSSSGRGRGGKSNVPKSEADMQTMEDTVLIGEKREHSERKKSEIKVQRGRGRAGRSDRQHKEITAPSEETQSGEHVMEIPSGRGRGKGGQSIRQQAEEALSRGGRRGRSRGRGSGTRNPRSFVSKQHSAPVMLRDEVCLSESSSSDDDSQVPAAKKQNPNSTLKQSTTNVSGTKVMGGQKKSKGPNVKQLLPSTAQALTVKRKTTGELSVSGGRRKVARVIEDESVAAFKEALGGDLDPRLMTVDDLGSDFSDG